MIKITVEIENKGDKIWFCKNEYFEETINLAIDEIKSIIKDEQVKEKEEFGRDIKDLDGVEW